MTEEQCMRFDRFFRAQRLDEANEVISEAIKSDPADWNALYIAGAIKRFRGDFKGAIQFYNLALKYNPNDYSILNAIGIAYQSLNQFPQAIEAFLHSIKLNPDNYESQNLIGLTYRLAGEFGAAMSAYERALEICANQAFSEVMRRHPECFSPAKPRDPLPLLFHESPACLETMRKTLSTDFNYFTTIKEMIGCCLAMKDDRRAADLQAHLDTCTPIDVNITAPFRINGASRRTDPGKMARRDAGA